MGEWESGRVGEWESGRVGEWKSGRVGEWKSGRVGVIPYNATIVAPPLFLPPHHRSGIICKSDPN